MNDKNLFGGGNKNSLYVPLSEIEQEVLHRIAAARDYRVHIKGWGMVEDPEVTIGDLRVAVSFQLEFHRPDHPMPLYFMDMELRTGAGRLLHSGRMDTRQGTPGGTKEPLMVSAGTIVQFVWDIMLTGLDPKLVREVIPDVKGLTSRQQDKVTREFTSEGNMVLNAHQKKMLHLLREGEAVGRKVEQEDRIEAVAAASKDRRGGVS